jgi:hypothetical protein
MGLSLLALLGNWYGGRKLSPMWWAFWYLTTKNNSITKMKKLHGILLATLFGMILIPTVALASWWNPISWFNNWQFFNKENSKTEVLEKKIEELENKLSDTKISELNIKEKEKQTVNTASTTDTKTKETLEQKALRLGIKPAGKVLVGNEDTNYDKNSEEIIKDLNSKIVSLVMLAGIGKGSISVYEDAIQYNEKWKIDYAIDAEMRNFADWAIKLYTDSNKDTQYYVDWANGTMKILTKIRDDIKNSNIHDAYFRYLDANSEYVNIKSESSKITEYIVERDNKIDKAILDYANRRISTLDAQIKSVNNNIIRPIGPTQIPKLYEPLKVRCTSTHENWNYTTVCKESTY